MATRTTPRKPGRVASTQARSTSSAPARSALASLSQSYSVEPSMPARSLLSRAVRVDAQALDAALSQINLNDANRRRVWAVLAEGRSQTDVCKEEGISRQLLSSIVRRVRTRLSSGLGPWTIVSVTLDLPLTLAEELRGLVDALNKMKDRDKAEALLREVQRVAVLAKGHALSEQ